VTNEELDNIEEEIILANKYKHHVFVTKESIR